MRAFLKSALKGAFYTLTPLPGDGGGRSYFRVRGKRGKALGVVVRATSLSQKKLFLKRRGELVQLKLPVPGLHFTRPFSLYTLLEDLGGEDLKSPSHRMPYYRQAIDNLFALQNKARALKWPLHSYHLLLKEMLWTKTFLINRYLRLPLKKPFLRACLKEWRHLCTDLATTSPYLPGHRDFHSQNLMIKKNRVYMIDFQDASFLPPLYDVVSLFYDPYAALSPSEKKRLLSYIFHHSLKPFAGGWKNMEKEWKLTGIQRLFKACGNFAEFYVLKNKSTHLKYIKPSLKETECMLRQIKTYPSFLKLTGLLIKRLPSWP